MNLNHTIIPKSDQLNADDLISGPRTIKITNVIAGSAEQPVCITYEGGEGRPYKPSKSMRRVFVSLWGSEGAAYVGRRVTIYRDPNVKFGGDLVGGVKISHLSHIDKPAELMLTATRGKRQPHRVEPLPDEKPAFDLGPLPEAWDQWTDEERGLNRSQAGVEPLKLWWTSLGSAQQQSLKTKLVEWKKIAESL